MKQRKYRYVKSISLVLLALMIVLSGLSFASSSKNTIVSLQQLTVEAEHLKPYALPKSVVVIMKDKTKQSLPVKWAISKVDTSKIGSFTYKGSVKGTNQQAILILKVMPSIISVEQPSATIGVNGVVILPKTVTVVLSDKKKGTRLVKWPATSVDTSKVGTVVTLGTISGSTSLVKHTANMVSIFNEVENLNVTLKVKDDFTLPKEVFGTSIKGEAGYTPVRWLLDSAKVDTSKGGVLNIEGLATGYPKKVSAVITINAMIETIENKNVTLYANDIYSIPKEVTAYMNDGSTKNVPVKWLTPLPNLKVRGSYEILGTVDEYAPQVKYTYIVKSDFLSLQKSVNYTQWGYIPLRFSKALSPNQNPSRVILKDSAGSQITIISLNVGVGDKNSLLITPSRPLQKGMTYTLTIPANTVVSLGGETQEDELVFAIEYK